MSCKTLFVDRDGVINSQIIGGYVTCVDEFEILPGVLDAFSLLASQFDRIVVVTNQQGIGKGVFTVADLDEIHAYMLNQIEQHGGRIDHIYFCSDLESANSPYRKPNSGMGLQAQKDFPEIDFQNTIMVGDSLLDMQFGKNLGVKTVFLSKGNEVKSEVKVIADAVFVDLIGFATAYPDIFNLNN